MGICLKCGAVFHDDDELKHICKPENVPAKGKEKIPTSTLSDVV